MSRSMTVFKQVPLNERLQNAKTGVPSDARATLAKIGKIADMRLSDYCKFSPEVFEILKDRLGVSIETTYMQTAATLEKLLKSNDPKAEETLWAFAVPLITVYNMIKWMP